MSNIQYRHEKKYIITDIQSCMLQERLKYIMRVDDHAGPNSRYLIKSLYFDDADNSCYYDNENGIGHRKKYRLRYYNCDDSFIQLECKHKEKDMTYKESERICKEDALKLIKGDVMQIALDTPLINSFQSLNKTSALKPVVITKYERFPLVYNLGNVRITFDQKLSSSIDINNFFSEDISSRPIFPVGISLLEVKYDSFLPDFIHETLEINTLQETAFSKYYYCRKFSMRG